MEILPCSGVSYVRDSECPQQSSGTAFMCSGESDGVKPAEEIQGNDVDVKFDELYLNVEQPEEERDDGSKWNLEGFPASEGDNNGDTFYEFEADSQKLSFDSQDSEDDKFNAQDHSSGPCVDTIQGGLESSYQETGLSLSEPKWLEQDESLAVWVKWRGKWQAGIRCARADWPLPTLKAKPTHDRKKYLVIFFPRTRNYCWADELLVRPIHQLPQPIAYKTHEVGMKLVKDLTLARRFVMQKLAVGMLSILDQLRCEALVETARNVMAWKDFALEASCCKSYSDLGKMLLKLQNMILHCCINSHWLQHTLPSWAQQCQNADSAESVETLKEELVNSILWDEVQSLSNGSAQLELNTEWKTWKHEVMKWFSISNPTSNCDIEQHSNDSPPAMENQMSRKRPKLEVRRAEGHSSQVGPSSNQDLSFKIDSDFFSGDVLNAAPLDSEASKDSLSLEGTAPTGSPGTGCVADRWCEIAVEAGKSDVMQMKDFQVTPPNSAGTRKSVDAVNKSRQCAAFIENKGRQCVRWANEGDIYCCVHLASRFAGSVTKAESVAPIDSPMCEGTTVLGTKCKHRSLHGSSFCKKHRRKADKGVIPSSSENKLKRKHDDGTETAVCEEIVPAGGVEAMLQLDVTAAQGGEAFNGNYSVMLPEHSWEENNAGDVENCIGLVSDVGNETCQELPKRHSLYCEKHLPSWLKRARNGKSRIVSKEVFMELLKCCHSREQKLNLHQACELFYRFFKSVLSSRNPVPKEVQYQWAVSEAAKDAGIGGFLTKLVISERVRLERLWSFNTDDNLQASSSLEKPVIVPMAVDNDHDIDHDDDNILKCKICSEKFLDDQALGTHFMEHHKKEAQWLFRGYVCAICLDSFTNKKVLEAHVQERHRVQFVEQCMLLQCIPCGGRFGNTEQLWAHVLSAHPDNFRFSNAVENNTSVNMDTMQNLVSDKSTSAENVNSENQSGIRKYICRFCGLKFDLLPDLGRHHQAAHMGPTAAGPRIAKRGLHLYAQKLKSGRLTRPGFKKGLGSASYRIRNRNAQSIKKRIQASNLVSAAKMKVQPTVSDTADLGRLADSQCSAIAKVLFSEIKKTKPRPSNMDIISIARSTCCKVSLQASLEARYGILPKSIYLKAAKLCSEQNILVNWHHEGFSCPRGCRPILSPDQLPPLLPLADDAVTPRSSVCVSPSTSEWTMDECHYVIDSRHFNQDSAERIILCDDISFSKESVPIACAVDENLLGSLHIHADGCDSEIAYSLPWESFTYITKPILHHSLGVEAETLQLGCACPNSACSPAFCDHVYLFDNDYEDAKDIHGKPMHGRFPYDERGRIILEEGYLVYECNQRCGCSKSCQNRVLQNGVRVKLEIFKTEKKGWAVRAREPILRGTFVCEYIGEVIDDTEATERRNRYGNEGCGYFYEIDAQINDISRLVEGQATFVIDATNYGNVSRYINHSCSPNLVNHQVLVESMDCQLAHIGLFASRDISIGEELTYDYKYKLLPGEGCQCLCGASNCRGRLY